MRIIGHLDMDAFFAAVEERDNPRFKGRPIIVGADPEDGAGRGVVSTANYKAREYGIHSAMPISKAWQLAEKAKAAGRSPAIFTGGHFRKYSEVSAEIMKIVKKHVSVTEKASVDEAYMDLSFAKNYQNAEEICKKIKSEIKKKEKITASIGVGPNKLIAKIASDMLKPDGLTVIKETDAEKFMEPLNIRKIPGVGPKAELMFARLKVKTVKDLKRFTETQLREKLGKWGAELYRKARGQSDSPVEEGREVKSIGEQETFHNDTKDLNYISDRLADICQDVIDRFKKSEFATFKTVGITVRFSDFETKTRAHTLPEPATDYETLRFEAMKLLLPFLDKRENPKRKLIRLIGVKMEKLRREESKPKLF